VSLFDGWSAVLAQWRNSVDGGIASARIAEPRLRGPPQTSDTLGLAVDPLVAVGAATVAIELVAALLLATAFLHKPADREYGLAALLAVAAAGHGGAHLLSSQLASADAAVAADWISRVGLVSALALGVHFAFAYRGVRNARWIPAGLYMLAAGLVAAQVGQRVAPLPAMGITTHVACAVAGTLILALVAHAYLSGRRGALSVVVGATVLLATAINDVGVSSGVLATGYFSDAGLAALVIGIAMTPGFRYAAASKELERVSQELGTRTQELRRSDEDLRTAQEELVKKEQLAVVGELAAVIAHEVRNPLAILDEETSRLNRLVTDLLRYARPVNVQRSNIAIGDVLERALALANTEAKTIQMDLKMEAHDARLWGDANLLRQVFDNLIDNAVQAMGPSGMLTIRVRTDTRDGADGLGVDIIDTGEGMDTQVRSRALDPFFTTRPSGTGLGLAIVDRIVEAHGGHLAIDSRAGEGTTVTVFLPHGSASEPPPLRTRSARPAAEPPPVREVP
jgi:signal transduction histidine kinase